MVKISCITAKAPNLLQSQAMFLAAFQNGATNSRDLSPLMCYNNILSVLTSDPDEAKQVRFDEAKLEIYIFSQGTESNTVILKFM